MNLLNHIITKLRQPRTVSPAPEPRKFGTFDGVFLPTLLTILGAVMYLRTGWVVGNAGFFGAVIIILLAKSVSFSTGLSMSSITTNIKIVPVDYGLVRSLSPSHKLQWR